MRIAHLSCPGGRPANGRFEHVPLPHAHPVGRLLTKAQRRERGPDLQHSLGMNWRDSLAEWSKALAARPSPQGSGFKPHSCHSICVDVESGKCAKATLQPQTPTMLGQFGRVFQRIGSRRLSARAWVRTLQLSRAVAPRHFGRCTAAPRSLGGARPHQRETRAKAAAGIRRTERIRSVVV